MRLRFDYQVSKASRPRRATGSSRERASRAEVPIRLVLEWSGDGPRLADRTARRSLPSLLDSAHVRFVLRASTRATMRGVRRSLVLEVWPATGFDDYAWAADERTWLGRTVVLNPIDLIEADAATVLDGYASGDEPPFD